MKVIISLTAEFPYRYPVVYEIGGRFPIDRSEELHINYDSSLCLEVPQRELIHASSGVATVDFIPAVLIPNLAWRICKLEDFGVNLKEHRHELLGILDEYKSMLKTSEKKFVVLTLERLINARIPPDKSTCYCDSGKKYADCHKAGMTRLQQLPIEMITLHLSQIKKDPKCQ